MKPTAERVRSLLVYDAGERRAPFRWQSWFKAKPWEELRDYSSVNDEGYLLINIDGEFYRADELAWLIMKGEWPAHEMVHADFEKLNNSWDNIKEKTALLKVT